MAKRKVIHLPGGRTIKMTTLLVSLTLILAIALGGTLALLLDRSGDMRNTFTPTTVECKVNSDGSITNISGDDHIRAYIRAAIVPTWQKEVNGEVQIFSEAPNYTVESEGWILSDDGYYYWPTPVEPGEKTGKLSAETEDTPVEDYKFIVEIAAQAIQADGVKIINGEEVPAVVDAWGVTLADDGVTIEAKTITSE